MIHRVFCPRCNHTDLEHYDDGALVCRCGCVFWVRLIEDETRSKPVYPLVAKVPPPGRIEGPIAIGPQDAADQPES